LRHFAVAVIVIAVPATALQAQTMPVSTFLAKADALKKKGPLALLSSDLNLLKKEVQGAALSLRQERLAAKGAGQRQAFCPPEKGVSLGPDEVLGHFRSIPPAQRDRTQVRDAMRTLMAKKFPCPA
jgi:hypothetical protein